MEGRSCYGLVALSKRCSGGLRYGGGQTHQGGGLSSRRQIECARKRLVAFNRAEALRRHVQPLAKGPNRRRLERWRGSRPRVAYCFACPGRRGDARGGIDSGPGILLWGRWTEAVSRPAYG